MNRSMLQLRNVFLIGLTVLSFYSTTVLSMTFQLPGEDSNIVGYLQQATIGAGVNLGDFLYENRIGFFELIISNPKHQFDPPQAGSRYIIPTQFVLPAEPRRGIVINLPERRLYYYPPNQSVVMTYAIGIGEDGTETPLVHTRVVEKRKDPIWIPVEKTKQREAQKGVILPPYIEPGPLNPLGDYALRLGLTEYSIHGTNDPYGVGLSISAGCIRLYPDDIKELFHQVQVGTPVAIVSEPIRIGYAQQTLYLEIQPRYPHERDYSAQRYNQAVELLNSTSAHHAIQIDWDKVKTVVQRARGYPEPIGQLLEPWNKPIVKQDHPPLIPHRLAFAMKP